MTIDLQGRVALVTGASRGIGAAIAEALAESGARVAVHYHASAGAANKMVDHIGGECTALRADLASLTETRKLFESTIDHFGRVDILVNNAGVSNFSPVDDPDAAWAAAWDHTMHVNLRAAEQLTRLAIEHFRERTGGRIIYIASRAAFRGDTPEYMTYAASKAGMVALARSVARGYGRDGIRAFVIAPGFTRTDMASEFIDAYGEAHATADIALERLTEPADIAPLAVLLASGLADHATGTTIDVNAASYIR